MSGQSQTVRQMFIHAGPGTAPMSNLRSNQSSAAYVDDHVAMLVRDGQSWDTYYYHADALFNVLALTDANAALAERAMLEPYGTACLSDGAGDPLAVSAVGNPFLRQGIVRGGETQQDDNRHRWYSPTLGRWGQRDPLFTNANKAVAYGGLALLTSGGTRDLSPGSSPGSVRPIGGGGGGPTPPQYPGPPEPGVITPCPTGGDPRARDPDPVTGRWESRDLYSYHAGLLGPNLPAVLGDDRVASHENGSYEYLDSQPTLQSDPSGLLPPPKCGRCPACISSPECDGKYPGAERCQRGPLCGWCLNLGHPSCKGEIVCCACR